MSTIRPQEAVERALSLSRADDCVVIADEASTANLRWAGNTLTTNGVTRSSRLTVIALRRTADGVAAGVVSRSAVGADGIEDLVRAAEADAAGQRARRGRPPAGHRGAGRRGVGRRPGRDRHRRVRGVRARARRSVRRRAGPGDRRLYGFANHVLTSSFLGTSAGLRLRHDQPSGLLELNAKGAGGSAWAGVGTRDFTDVDVPALTGDLARRLQWGERRVDLPAGRYETVLPPSAVADLMIYLYWSAGAQDAHDGRTVFSAPGGGTRVGEKIANLPVTLSSDPAAPGMECAPFVIAHASGRESSVFDNGLPLHATDWIGDGTLKALAQTRHSAERTGLPVTPAVDNLAMRGPDGGASLEEMVARTERGLLLTCLWYIREVDPQSLLLTGLTRDGVYLVEDGEVVGAVNNFRFNESPVDLLSRLAEVGATVPTLPREWSDYFTRAAMPPVRVGDFNMSTVSQAS
ncbi:metallopeptidase TldD-related protein [Actinomadura madurae]|uniref:metallopeptidase TldD-related protein n=1 Tax=Actinomadura madurae TaxID=1993 RepID=UPI0027E2A2F0|nr:metallopeptidase TldD-related protein [Actinomadura madurae]